MAHFLTLAFWKDRDVIEGVAGADVDAAKYYPEHADFLLEFEPAVAHYEVVGRA